MRKGLVLVSMLLALLSCGNERFVFREGDLLFCVAGEDRMSQAISGATFRRGGTTQLSFDHVAMVALDSLGHAYVIEASPPAGVNCVDLSEFIENHNVVVKRLRYEFPARDAVKRALGHLGEEYDWSYLPDNGKMYCSELIYECYLKADGSHVFRSAPMNFRDEDGNVPEFWLELFGHLGVDVPEGVPGTNPNDMAADVQLLSVHVVVH